MGKNCVKTEYIGNKKFRYYETPDAYLPAQNINSPDLQQHSEKFNSDDRPALWQPLLSTGLFDHVGTENYYRSFVFAILNKIAMNVAVGKIELYRKFKSKQTKITDHPFLNLLQSRNNIGQSIEQMLYLAVLNAKLFGFGCLLVNRVTSGLNFLNNIPVEFVHLPAKFVQPVYNSDGTNFTSFRFNGSFGVGGVKQFDIPLENIIYFKEMNPLSNLLGYSPIKAFNFTLDIDLMQSSYQYNGMKNDGLPNFVIQLPGKLNDPAYERYKKRYDEIHSGVKNARRPLILDNDAKAQAIHINAKEMDFVNSRKMIVDEILFMLDMPKQVMGQFEGSNYNNSRNALLFWIENTITPYAAIVFNSMLTKFVQDNYDKKLITSIEYPIGDPEIQIKLATQLRNFNIISTNEARQLAPSNLEDIDDARADDVFYSSANMTETERITVDVGTQAEADKKLQDQELDNNEA